MGALSIVLLCIGGVCLVVGIGFLFPARIVGKLSATTRGIIRDITLDAMKYNASTSSPAEGEVSGTKFVVRAGVGGTIRKEKYTKHVYHSVYFYNVNGIEYSRADGPGYNKGLAEKKIGEQVTVYYDPSNPLKSSLSSGKVYKILSLFLISLGVLSGIVGIISVFIA